MIEKVAEFLQAFQTRSEILKTVQVAQHQTLDHLLEILLFFQSTDLKKSAEKFMATTLRKSGTALDQELLHVSMN